MSNNPYADVIDIITNVKENEWKKIVVQIAKTNPAAIKRATERLGMIAMPKPTHRFAEEDWFDEMIGYIGENKKINAIKVMRNGSGLGLREAKLEVEEIMETCKWYIEHVKLQKISN